MKRYFSVAEIEANFDEIFEMVENGDQIYITRDGIPVAVMMPIQAYDEMQKAIAKLNG